MPHLLHLDTSARVEGSVSRAVTRTFADTWRAASPAHTVTTHDLQAEPPPHLTDPGLHWAPRLRAPEEQPSAAAIAAQDALLAPLLAADALLIGVPLYNYSLPSTLKAWLDHIHVLGTTAPYDTTDQPLAGRPAVIVTSRGASYDVGSPTDGWDHAIPPLKLVLGQALGMVLRVITVDLTLADRIPQLAEFQAQAATSLAAAHTAAADAARSLAAA